MWLSSFLLFTDIWAQHSFFTFFSDQSQVYHLGSNYNNRRGDLDTAIKKVSPVEQRLIYQSWYVWIHSWRVNVKRRFYRKASVITEFMNQWGAWFASWKILDSSISSSILWKHQTYLALISIAICVKIEANQYLQLIRRYPSTWRRSSFVA